MNWRQKRPVIFLGLAALFLLRPVTLMRSLDLDVYSVEAQTFDTWQFGWARSQASLEFSGEPLNGLKTLELPFRYERKAGPRILMGLGTRRIHGAEKHWQIPLENFRSSLFSAYRMGIILEDTRQVPRGIAAKLKLRPSLSQILQDLLSAGLCLAFCFYLRRKKA